MSRYQRPYDGAEMRDEPPRPATTRAEGGRFDGITDLTRLTDGSVMCCICFEYTPPDQLWRDTRGQAWDVCQPCGDREDTPEFMGEPQPEEDKPWHPSADTS